MTIVFASGADGPSRCEIYSIEADGTALRSITDTPNGGCNFPALSPDNLRLAFNSDQQSASAIYVADVDGQNLALVTPLAVESAMPSWSPDGRKLAYVSKDDGPWAIHTIDLNGSEINLVAKRDVDSWGPKWSPDETQLTFFGSSDDKPDSPEGIFLVNSDGTDMRQLTNNDSRETYPDWSPDGKSLLFGSLREGVWDTYIMDLESGTEKRVTYTPPGHHGSWLAAWSPDGKRITFVSDRHAEYNERLLHTEIYVMDVGASEQTRLTFNECFDVHPAW